MTKPAGRSSTPDEALAGALAQAGTVLDEADTEYVIAAVLPVLQAHGWAEYERGIEYGDWSARDDVARRLGLGALASPTADASRV